MWIFVGVTIGALLWLFATLPFVGWLALGTTVLLTIVVITGFTRGWRVLGFYLVPEANVLVGEFLGKFMPGGFLVKSILRPGLHWRPPILWRVRYHQLLKEQTIDIPVQKILAAGVIVDVDGILYFKIGLDPDTIAATDAEIYAACYGVEGGGSVLTSQVRNPRAALEELARATLRDVIGRIAAKNFKDLEDKQDEINVGIKKQMGEATKHWGIIVMRHEIQNLLPPESMRVALEAQVKAEAQSAATIALAEGQKQATVRAAEADKQARILKAEARKEEQVLDAEGEGARLERLAMAASKPGADKAFDFQIAEEMADAIKGLGEKGNATIFAPSGLSELGALGAGAMSFLKQARGQRPTALPSPDKDTVG